MTDEETDHKTNDYRMRTEESKVETDHRFIDNSSNISFNRGEDCRSEIE